MRLFSICVLLSVLTPTAYAQVNGVVESRISPSRLPENFRELSPSQSFPASPMQSTEWNAPDDELGRSVRRLFAAGMADPRGLEYREVVLADEPPRPLVPERPEWQRSFRAFVLPARVGEAEQFAVMWNGQIMRISFIGALCDWHVDAQHLAEGPIVPVLQHYVLFQKVETLDCQTPTVLKAIMAARLGVRSAAAISLEDAATEWVTESLDRAKAAHMRGDDVTALALAQRAVDARNSLNDVFVEQARKMGWDRTPWLSSMDTLLADQKRRAGEKQEPRTPENSATTSRLINDLESIRESQSFQSGFHFFSNPTVRALIEQGQLAVPQLIDAVESDDRLTRSAETTRNTHAIGAIQPVSFAAYDALMQIWGTGQTGYQLFGSRDDISDPTKRTALVRKLRAYAATHSK